MDNQLCPSCKLSRPVSDFERRYKKILVDPNSASRRKASMCKTCISCRNDRLRHHNKLKNSISRSFTM